MSQKVTFFFSYIYIFLFIHNNDAKFDIKS